MATATAQARAFADTSAALTLRAATLAKEANSRIVKLSLDFEEDGHLLDFSFQEEAKNLKARVKLIRNLVGRFLSALHKGSDLPELKRAMESVEKELLETRSSARQRYEILKVEGELLEREIAQLSQSINAPVEPAESSNHPGAGRTSALAPASAFPVDYRGPASAFSSSRADSMPEDVLAFQEFQALHGGRTGGWDDADHTIFLRHYQQKDGRVSKRLLDALATKTAEEVQNHAEWYDEYISLQSASKTALREWRELRRQPREPVEQEADEESQMVGKPAPTRKPLDAEAARRRIEAWKEEKAQRGAKEREMQEQEERERLEKRMRAMKLEKEERERARDLIQARKELQRERELIAQTEGGNIQEKKKVALSKETVQAHHQRDLTYVERKNLAMQEKAEAQKQRQRQQEHLLSLIQCVAVSPSIERATGPTAATEIRCMTDEAKPKKFEVNRLPRRHVPTWRK